MEPMQKPVWLSTKEAADWLGVTPRTVLRLVDAGELEAYRIGSRNIRIQLADIQTYVAARKVQPGSLGASDDALGDADASA